MKQPSSMPIQAKPGASIDVTPMSGSANQIYGDNDFETVRKPRETRCSASCYLHRTVAVAPTAWRHCSWRSLLSPARPTTERAYLMRNRSSQENCASNSFCPSPAARRQGGGYSSNSCGPIASWDE